MLKHECEETQAYKRTKHKDGAWEREWMIENLNI